VGHLLAEAAALPPEVVEEIVKRTVGVPLFLEEVTKVVPETALTNTAGGAIAVLPSSIGGAPDLQASLMARLDRRVAGHPLSALLSHRVSRLRARTVCPIGDLAGGSEPAELGVSAEAAEGHRRGRLWIDLTPSLRARRMAENGASRSLPCVPGEGLLIERRNGRSASAARTSLYVESPSVSALTTIAVG